MGNGVGIGMGVGMGVAMGVAGHDRGQLGDLAHSAVQLSELPQEQGGARGGLGDWAGAVLGGSAARRLVGHTRRSKSDLAILFLFEGGNLEVGTFTHRELGAELGGRLARVDRSAGGRRAARGVRACVCVCISM